MPSPGVPAPLPGETGENPLCLHPEEEEEEGWFGDPSSAGMVLQGLGEQVGSLGMGWGGGQHLQPHSRPPHRARLVGTFFPLLFIQAQLLAERSQGVVGEYKHHPSAGLASREGSLHSVTRSFPCILGKAGGSRGRGL